MSYVDEFARAIEQELPPDLIPDGDTDSLFRIYALLALVKGLDVGPEDVHDAWSAWMSERDPEHPSLRPYAELGAEKRQSDEPFVTAIKAVAAARPQIAPAR